MKKIPLSFFVLLLLFASSGCSGKRAKSADELAKIIVEAFKTKNADLLVQYHISESEAQKFRNSFVAEDENKSMQSFLSIYSRFGIPGDDSKSKGLSEETLADYFADDFSQYRRNFNIASESAASFGIDWAKVKIEKIRFPGSLKKKYGQEPTWIRIWCNDGKNKFFIFLQNVVRVGSGWTCGLSINISDQVIDLSKASGNPSALMFYDEIDSEENSNNLRLGN